MVLWRSQADEIEALRAEVGNLRREIAAQQAELEEMDTLVERMVLCDSKAQMQLVPRRATTLAGRRQKEQRGDWYALSEPAESTALICSPKASSPIHCSVRLNSRSVPE